MAAGGSSKDHALESGSNRLVSTGNPSLWSQHRFWDLRFIATALKIVKDLEHIGNMAVDIAERVLAISREVPVNRGSASYGEGHSEDA